jgi:hypothetical protein
MSKCLICPWIYFTGQDCVDYGVDWIKNNENIVNEFLDDEDFYIPHTNDIEVDDLREYKIWKDHRIEQLDYWIDVYYSELTKRGVIKDENPPECKDEDTSLQRTG